MPIAHLIDASPYVFRAYFSLPDSIRDPTGRPVQAVHGFASFLLKLIADERPTHLGICFDRSLSTSFRNDLYPPYKAQRALPPPELEAQLEDCQELARALGAATFADAVYEADDLIGALDARLRRDGHGAVVVTSDKDLAQLVSPRVDLLDFAKGERLGPAAVRDKFGVEPAQIADLLALAGDPVDNIPGVAGIGRKGAAELLGRFGTLDAIYERIDEVATLADLRGARALATKLAAGREMAFLCRRLARVATEAPIDPPAGPATDLETLEYRGADRALVGPLLERLGFRRLGERIAVWR